MSEDIIVTKIVSNIIEEPSKEIGNIITQPLKAIKYFIMDPLIKYNIGKEQEYKVIEKELEEKIKKIDPKNLKNANIRILAGVNEGLKYSAEDLEIRNAFLNLLKSSIDKSKEEEIHVSFSEILKQLEPDEARIIEYFNSGNVFKSLIDKGISIKQGKVYPFAFVDNGRIPKVDVYKINKDNTEIEYIKNFTWLSFINFIENPDKINIYLDNLKRLNLIEINSEKFISNDFFYESILTKHPVIKNYIDNGNYRIEKGYIQLTNVGENFAKCCCDFDKLKIYEIDLKKMSTQTF